MATEYELQVRGPGLGFLPEAWARPALAQGLLVEKGVRPKAGETLYLSCRSGEEGVALMWWLDRMRTRCPFARMSARICWVFESGRSAYTASCRHG